MQSYFNLIEKIKTHTLGNKDEAFNLYFAFCDCLNEKYGLVDKDFDENPTRRGKEWIDIHHILEYELDDIARRTKSAQNFNRACRQPIDDYIAIALKPNECDDDQKKQEIIKQYPNKKIAFWGLDYTLEELKPYNVKEQLVYANKIEHFLLHYLIDSIRGQNIFSGGPNYIWDDCVALEVYGFDKEYFNMLKHNKDSFYSVLSCKEITLLYKKLIDWKNWDILRCSHFWKNYISVTKKIKNCKISYVENVDLFFNLMNILNFPLPDDIFYDLPEMPFKYKSITKTDGTIYKADIDNNIFSADGKTIIQFHGTFMQQTFTVNRNIRHIANTAFIRCFLLEQIVIPTSVQTIEDTAFKPTIAGHPSCRLLKKIIYKGTIDDWNQRFSNVDIKGLELICNRRKTKLPQEHISQEEYEKIILTLISDIQIKSNDTIQLHNLEGNNPIKKLQLKCKMCGHIFESTPQEISNMSEISCPNCKS